MRGKAVALAVAALAGCMTSGQYLERSPGKPDNLDDLWPCLHTAQAEVAAGKVQLTPEEQRALGDREIWAFLDWSSMTGPRPVVSKGRPAEVPSALMPEGDVRVTQRYVLCLLRNGYEWPTAAAPETAPAR